MNKITINYESIADTGLNINQLKQSNCFSSEYEHLFQDSKGALTQVYGDDVDSIFEVAISKLNPNDIQVEILQGFQEQLKYIENCIDPERLKFTITRAMDNEICINRKATTGGRVKLIINEDGTIALSFLPDKGSNQGKSLDFYSIENQDNFERIAYDFFIF